MYSFKQIIEGATDKANNIIFLSGVKMQLTHFQTNYRRSSSTKKLQMLLTSTKKGERSCAPINGLGDRFL